MLERVSLHLTEGATTARRTLDRVADELACETRVGRVLIAVRYAGERVTRIEASVGLSEDERRRGFYGPGEGVVGAVVEGGQAIAGETRPRSLQAFGGVWPPRTTGVPFRFACVPVIVRSHGVVGAIGMDRLLPAPSWQREDVQILWVVAALIADTVVALRDQREETSERDRDNARLRRPPAAVPQSDLVAESPAMREALELAHKIAPSTTAVLLFGESGSGKETLAREIHARSACAGRPFETINCGASTAQAKLQALLGGSFDRASPGTLLFDDVDELAPAAQAQLSRLLYEAEENGRSLRGGAAADGCSRPRVVAATQVDLWNSVRGRRFREDLYFRLTAFPIGVPPLRERTADIPLIADRIARRTAEAQGRRYRPLDTAAVEALSRHDWPGNLRELDSAIVRALLASEGDSITLADLPGELRIPERAGPAPGSSLKERIASFERALIADALQDANGNRAAAARALETTPRILSYRMQRLGIEPARPEDEPAAR